MNERSTYSGKKLKKNGRNIVKFFFILISNEKQRKNVFIQSFIGR